jgi:hypothetical protein
VNVGFLNILDVSVMCGFVLVNTGMLCFLLDREMKISVELKSAKVFLKLVVSILVYH